MSITQLRAQDYNPDILNTLANLSSDEVFTPPEVANQVLDLLPQDLFQSPDTTFLDPACKSGVFLREIARRLMAGLADVFPDEQERRDHIFHHQLFGIAITELTSLMSRRSLYCSKFPNGRYSVSQFDSAEGNLRFKQLEHRFIDGKCAFCPASENQFGKKVREGLEYHAYEFIHTTKPEEIFGMKFDVIIGNPPYQLSDGGAGPSALPIYNKFVEQSIKLKPRFITMIIPSRWFIGGRGLDSFRNKMLTSQKIRHIVDFINANDCFPGVEIKGGVCFFLWDRDYQGDCTVVTNKSNTESTTAIRSLLEDGMETFTRFSEQVEILKKVKILNEKSFITIVSANDPYGFDVREANSYKRVRAPYSLKPNPNSVMFYYNGWRKEGIGYVDKKYIRKGHDLVKREKIFVPRVWGRGDMTEDRVNPFIVGKNTCSTETFLTIGPCDDIKEAENITAYMKTKFVHFMVSYMKNTQQAMQRVYTYVPLQDFSKPWTDAELYAKYGLTEEEIAFIESMIRPMELNGGDEVAQ